MLSRSIIAGVFCVSLAACGTNSGYSGYSGESFSAGSSGSSTVPHSAAAPRTTTVGPIGGIDNGQFRGAMEGAAPTGGSSGGVGDGPPGGIANNQMSRISE